MNGGPAIRTLSAPRGAPRAFATLLVLWAVTLASILLIAVQAAGFRQAVAGREALARVRAYWAARAGVEAAVARLAWHNENPDPNDAMAVIVDLESVADGSLDGAAYSIAYHEHEGELHPGPADAHAKININAMTYDDLMLLDYMTEDVADAILDWIDEDDDPNTLGAEAGYYLSAGFPYEPRNGPVRSILELELVAGVNPETLRGEDWNLNGVLDPNEDDGDASWPPDNADGTLDAGWSGVLTACSVAGPGYGLSGLPRLDLNLISDTTYQGEFTSRLGISTDQAEAIAQYISGGEATMAELIEQDLNDLVGEGGGGGGGRGGGSTVEDLDEEQLAALVDETYLDDPTAPGKLNINTFSDDTLYYLASIDTTLADSIVFERDARAGGFTRLWDLTEIPGIGRAQLADLYPVFCVRAEVFVVTSRGWDERTGFEVEIVVTVDRSSLPVVIKEVVLQ